MREEMGKGLEAAGPGVQQEGQHGGQQEGQRGVRGPQRRLL